MSINTLSPHVRDDLVGAAELTVVTCLVDGRHLVHSTLIRQGEDVRRVMLGHCLIRKHHVAGLVSRFVVVLGDEPPEVFDAEVQL